ncbi:MAG: DUF6150 family protein [Myxococcota bacterium]
MRTIRALSAFVCLFVIGFEAPAWATHVFVTEFASRAQKRVYVVKNPRKANCFVYKSTSPTAKKGQWYFVKRAQPSALKIHFVKYESSADVKVFFVSSPERVRCRF